MPEVALCGLTSKLASKYLEKLPEKCVNTTLVLSTLISVHPKIALDFITMLSPAFWTETVGLVIIC